MSDPIAPVSGMGLQERGDRSPDEPSTTPEGKGAAARSLVPQNRGDRAQASPETPALSGAAVFAAQVLGQSGRRRGLKGGPPVLEEAKSAYLEAEWSGPNDRRTRAGRISKTEI